MASVFCRGTKAAPRFFARFKSADGRWVSRRVRQQTRRDALRVATALEARAERQRVGLEAPESAGLLCGRLMRRWAISLTNRSRATDLCRIDRHVLPHWRGVRMVDVDLPRIMMLARRAGGGGRDRTWLAEALPRAVVALYVVGDRTGARAAKSVQGYHAWSAPARRAASPGVDPMVARRRRRVARLAGAPAAVRHDLLRRRTGRGRASARFWRCASPTSTSSARAWFASATRARTATGGSKRRSTAPRRSSRRSRRRRAVRCSGRSSRRGRRPAPGPRLSCSSTRTEIGSTATRSPTPGGKWPGSRLASRVELLQGHEAQRGEPCAGLWCQRRRDRRGAAATRTSRPPSATICTSSAATSRRS